MSIHRLTREAYFDTISRPERLESFTVDLGLFRKPFSRTAGGHLYETWDLCSKLIHHVQALGSRYVELGDVAFYSPKPVFSEVFNDAGWYDSP